MLKSIIKKILGGQDTKKLESLYKRAQPEKKEDIPQFQVFAPNLIHQADLLFISNDKGYKYILVVVDNHSKKMDAEKLKDKYSSSVLKAFKKIYDRKILSMPQQIEVDDGSEFKGLVKDYFEQHKVRIRTALPSRHRQQGLVERKNQILGSLIQQLQTHKELGNKKISKEWIKILPQLIEYINEHVPKPITEAISEEPLSNDYNRNLLTIGQRVRLKLDHPVDSQGKKLSGTFRSGDIRWTQKIFKVTQVLLKPGFVPMYMIDKTNETSFTKEQLQAVSRNQTD